MQRDAIWIRSTSVATTNVDISRIPYYYCRCSTKPFPVELDRMIFEGFGLSLFLSETGHIKRITSSLSCTLLLTKNPTELVLRHEVVRRWDNLTLSTYIVLRRAKETDLAFMAREGA